MSLPSRVLPAKLKNLVDEGAERLRRPAGRRHIRIVLGAGSSPGLDSLDLPDNVLRNYRRWCLGWLRKVWLPKRARSIVRRQFAMEFSRLKNDKLAEAFLLWDNYELARFISMNVPPPPVFHVIHHLCEHDLVDSVVTTNYDLHFEAAFGRAQRNYQVHTNPHVDKSTVQVDSADAVRSTGVRYWKIHGSLDVVYYPACDDAFSHPPFALSGASPRFIELLKGVGLQMPDTLHDYASQEHPSCRRHDCCGPAYHFTDEVFANREPFKRVIREAVRDLNSPGLGMILCIGFRGVNSEESKSHVGEELREQLIALANDRDVPIVAFLQPGQRPTSFTRKVHQLPSGFVCTSDLSRMVSLVVGRILRITRGVTVPEWRETVSLYADEWEKGGLFMREFRGR